MNLKNKFISLAYDFINHKLPACRYVHTLYNYLNLNTNIFCNNGPKRHTNRRFDESLLILAKLFKTFLPRATFTVIQFRSVGFSSLSYNIMQALSFPENNKTYMEITNLFFDN